MSKQIDFINERIDLTCLGDSSSYSFGACGWTPQDYPRISKNAPSNLTDQVYQVVIQYAGKKIFSKDFAKQEDFECFVKSNTLPYTVSPLLGTFIPVYADTTSKFVRNLLFPNTTRHIKYGKSYAPLLMRCFCAIAAFALDVTTLPIRFFTIWASRRVFKQEISPLITQLKKDHPDLKLDTYLEVHLVAWKVVENTYSKGINNVEVAYSLFLDPVDGFPYSDSFSYWDNSTSSLKDKYHEKYFKTEYNNNYTAPSAGSGISSSLKCMGLKEPYTKDDVKKAFQKLCLKGKYRHPDKGGEKKLFQDLVNHRDRLLEALEKKGLS